MWRADGWRGSGEFGLNPWDTSAGYLLVEEAGGTITHFDGSKFTLDSPRGAGDEWGDSWRDEDAV